MEKTVEKIIGALKANLDEGGWDAQLGSAACKAE